ncbi:MAG: transcriptional repressor [Defluviitaleaceae bacterium]|nr:transcriptional repressor [Defluviitaleaceae bacterium]
MENRRNTVQRQLILNAVKELDVHATAEQVVEHLAKTHPAIGRATIYRNLNQMAESGELLKVGNFHGSTHYDHNCHEHYHFVCNECKCIFDVEGSFSNVLEKLADTEGFDITACNISFSGLCRECKVG